ncbi:MAG: hypothetical protein PUJ55_10815 [Clostridiales bacterium]|nr:hypothetical protein [Roseburia sp.]MDD7637412.1 hypothetical protein [Clostridiales bacterium]MDY4111970.1 hypothetical protein [Roseburia sp.]
MNNEKLIEKVDETIEKVCNEIQKKTAIDEDYADTVKALASLLEARAKLKEIASY